MQDDVREAFRRVGEIKVQLIKDRDSGESRGFGFITFSDASKAEEARPAWGGGWELGGAFTQRCGNERSADRQEGSGRVNRGSSRMDSMDLCTTHPVKLPAADASLSYAIDWSVAEWEGLCGNGKRKKDVLPKSVNCQFALIPTDGSRRFTPSVNSQVSGIWTQVCCLAVRAKGKNT